VAKLVFPVAAVVSNLINLMLSFIPLILIVLVMRHPFYWTWLYLPVPILALAILTLGATFFFATANVYYRDVAHILQIVLQVWFYLTPIIYSLDFFPPKYRIFFKLNPVIYVLNGFRLGVYYGLLPTLESVIASFVCAFAALYFGFWIFHKHQDEFVFYV
jgi:ABC-type polysaccharide/polyol phosphate export permease